MLFVDSSFITIFLPLALLSYFLSPRRARNFVLLLLSLLFYSVSSIQFLPVLLISIAVDYGVGLKLSTTEAPYKRKLLLLTSLCVNLGLLGYFKYIGLFSTTLREIIGNQIPIISAALPAGISFYTFQSMSYTIDLYRRRVEPVRSPIRFATYVSMFPQLIAGPIVRYEDIAKELADRKESTSLFASGCEQFILGMAKKILIADTIALIAAPTWRLHHVDFTQAWLAMILYSGQIYFDFSGYSDMAIGLGRMFGFRFPVNFDSPYQATSFSDFWRRWHITLSTWLRDYLYIPLGGNQHGPVRTYINLFLTMLLGGLWHGASWSYLLWGAMHGSLLAIERALRGRFPVKLPMLVRRFGVYLAVVFCWVPFKHNNFQVALSWMKSMLIPKIPNFSPGGTIILLAALTIAVVNIPRNTNDLGEDITPLRAAWALLLFPVAVFFAYGRVTLSPFLYFRF